MGSLSLLQRIFPTQGSPELLADSLPAEPQGNPVFMPNGSIIFHCCTVISKQEIIGLAKKVVPVFCNISRKT